MRCWSVRLLPYVRPLVEYNSVVWSPHLKRDIVAIEKVQKRFTKRLVGLKGLPYAERLKSLSLTSLELRRLHNDLLWCYKIVFGLVDITCDNFFQLCTSSVTRGHAYKLYKPCTSSLRSRLFASRVINSWNSLPPSTDFSSVNTFKRSISVFIFLSF